MDLTLLLPDQLLDKVLQGAVHGEQVECTVDADTGLPEPCPCPLLHTSKPILSDVVRLGLYPQWLLQAGPHAATIIMATPGDALRYQAATSPVQAPAEAAAAEAAAGPVEPVQAAVLHTLGALVHCKAAAAAAGGGAAAAAAEADDKGVCLKLGGLAITETALGCAVARGWEQVVHELLKGENPHRESREGLGEGHVFRSHKLHLLWCVGFSGKAQLMAGVRAVRQVLNHAPAADLNVAGGMAAALEMGARSAPLVRAWFEAGGPSPHNNHVLLAAAALEGGHHRVLYEELRAAEAAVLGPASPEKAQWVLSTYTSYPLDPCMYVTQRLEQVLGKVSAGGYEEYLSWALRCWCWAGDGDGQQAAGKLSVVQGLEVALMVLGAWGEVDEVRAAGAAPLSAEQQAQWSQRLLQICTTKLLERGQQCQWEPTQHLLQKDLARAVAAAVGFGRTKLGAGPLPPRVVALMQPHLDKLQSRVAGGSIQGLSDCSDIDLAALAWGGQASVLTQLASSSGSDLSYRTYPKVAAAACIAASMGDLNCLTPLLSALQHSLASEFVLQGWTEVLRACTPAALQHWAAVSPWSLRRLCLVLMRKVAVAAGMWPWEADARSREVEGMRAGDSAGSLVVLAKQVHSGRWRAPLAWLDQAPPDARSALVRLAQQSDAAALQRALEEGPWVAGGQHPELSAALRAAVMHTAYQVHTLTTPLGGKPDQQPSVRALVQFMVPPAAEAAALASELLTASAWGLLLDEALNVSSSAMTSCHAVLNLLLCRGGAKQAPHGQALLQLVQQLAAQGTPCPSALADLVRLRCSGQQPAAA